MHILYIAGKPTLLATIWLPFGHHMKTIWLHVDFMCVTIWFQLGFSLVSVGSSGARPGSVALLARFRLPFLRPVALVVLGTEPRLIIN